MNKEWNELIAKLSVDDLLRIFPALGVNTAYAWKSGRRSPPAFAQPALHAWIKSHAAKVQTRKPVV